MKGYKEKGLRTFRELKAALEHLDADAGIRVEGSIAGFNDSFIFVSRGAEGFIVNVCDSVRDESGAVVPGRSERWLNLKSLDEVMEFIVKSAKRPLRAYLY